MSTEVKTEVPPPTETELALQAKQVAEIEHSQGLADVAARQFVHPLELRPPA